MYTLAVHRDAEGDLEEIWNSAPDAAAIIVALLQEIKNDQNLLDALTAHDFGVHESKRFHVSKWLQFWNRGIDLWRIKLWDLERKGLAFRIIYAYETGLQRYYVLGIFRRDFNYDTSDPRVQRVLAAYGDLTS